MPPPEDRPSRFKTRFSLLSLLPARHPPLMISRPQLMPPTRPGPRHPTIISAMDHSPVHSEYPDPVTPLPPPLPQKRELSSSPSSQRTSPKRPPPLDLQRTKMMYPSCSANVVLDDGTAERVPPVPPLPAQAQQKRKKEEKTIVKVEDDPFEFAEVEAGHRYPSWKGGQVDIKPGMVIPRHMTTRPPVSTSKDYKTQSRAPTAITTPDNYESVLHDVLLTPTYLDPSPLPVPTPSPSPERWGQSSRSGNTKTLFDRATDKVFKASQRSRDPVWMPGKSILKIRSGNDHAQVVGTIQAMKEREEQEMERFRRNVRPVRLAVPESSRSFSTGSSPVRETSQAYTRRSPGWVGRTEWDAGGYKKETKRGGIVKRSCQPIWGWMKKRKNDKQQKLWKYSVIFALILLVALTVGLCTALLTRSSSKSDKSAISSNTTESSSSSPSATGSASSSSPSSTVSTSQTLTTCLKQFSDSAPTSPSSYPCSDCVPLLTSTTNDFSEPVVNGNSTGVGSALQFCALMDVLKKTEGNGLSGWGEDASPCGGWSGVSCDSRGRITSLTLQYPNVPSQLPDTLGNIHDLQALHLMGNSSVPTGNFPSSLLSLPSFITLDIEYTALIGPINTAPFSQAKGLTTLVLVNNANLGTTMPDLSSNSALLTVAVTGQNLTDGKVDKLPGSLTYLDLSYNSLSGQIPAFDQLTTLRTLYLQNNAFTSPPSSLPAGLTTLSLTSNPSLSGAMPESVCSNSALTSCDLRSTSLTGGVSGTASVSSVFASTVDSSIPSSSSTVSSHVVASSTAIETTNSLFASASASASVSPSAEIIGRADVQSCGVCQFS
ncbi:hypothetical protein IAR55_004112 [Kwoniella newhampshirensis]|uniref:Leucine-rich repeat-containing N-terminal plant-type domain-containing protein n=1 Tax=Kwoniella newhampshirensis TaxID=1651941 RepID=A0AAW0YYZ5_9TREE